MLEISKTITLRERVIGFVWQHLLLLFSLYFMTLGVALCVRSDLGSGVISAIPMAFALAGAEGLAPAVTIGGYTNVMNALFVLAQILILRRRFEAVQLFQLLVGFVFGWMLDFNMYVTSFVSFQGLPVQMASQLAGATILALGISAEVLCGSVTMPGEGIQVAISRVTGRPFPKVKIMVDSSLSIIAVLSGYYFFGSWPWTVVGPGTLFAMFYVGFMVRLVSPRMGWFRRLLAYRPGFRRYIYGLARYIYPGH